MYTYFILKVQKVYIVVSEKLLTQNEAGGFARTRRSHKKRTHRLIYTFYNLDVYATDLMATVGFTSANKFKPAPQ